MENDPEPMEEVTVKREIVEISDEEIKPKEGTPKKNDSRRRVTYAQLELLWEHLNSNRDIAFGFNKSAHARAVSRRLWEKLARSLNSLGDGADKDWKGWCKYWNDYKSKLKKLAASLKASQQTGEPGSVKKFSEIELKFLQILEEDSSRTSAPRVEEEEENSQEEHAKDVSTEGAVLQHAWLLSDAGCVKVSLYNEAGSSNTVSSEPPDESLPAPTSPPAPHSPMTSEPPSPAEIPFNPPRRRRRFPREPAVSLEANRRALGRISQRRLELDERKVKSLEELVDEVREIKEMIRARVKKKPDPSKYLNCGTCAKTFPSRAHLTIHTYTHTGERRFICSECGKAYKQSAHLKTHENKHRALELGKSALKSFTCPTCGSGFTQKSSLKIHERIHSGDKQYQCHICQKSFVQKYNLVYHVKTHTGDKQFECEICTKKFMTRYKLNVHYKRHAENKKRGRKKTQLLAADGEGSVDTTGTLCGSLADDDDGDDDDDDPGDESVSSQ